MKKAHQMKTPRGSARIARRMNVKQNREVRHGTRVSEPPRARMTNTLGHRAGGRYISKQLKVMFADHAFIIRDLFGLARHTFSMPSSAH